MPYYVISVGTSTVYGPFENDTKCLNWILTQTDEKRDNWIITTATPLASQKNDGNIMVLIYANETVELYGPFDNSDAATRWIDEVVTYSPLTCRGKVVTPSTPQVPVWLSAQEIDAILNGNVPQDTQEKLQKAINV